MTLIEIKLKKIMINEFYKYYKMIVEPLTDALMCNFFSTLILSTSV